MSETFSVEALRALALAEGVKFLYGQATEILKRWHERKQKQGTETETASASEKEPISISAPENLQGNLVNPQIHFQYVAKFEEELLDLRRSLSDYIEGFSGIDPKDQKLLDLTEALRRILELIYQQQISFVGESNRYSGPLIDSQIDINEVKGYVAGVRAKTIRSGTVRSQVSSQTVSEGAQIFGVDADTIG